MRNLSLSLWPPSFVCSSNCALKITIFQVSATKKKKKKKREIACFKLVFNCCLATTWAKTQHFPCLERLASKQVNLVMLWIFKYLHSNWPVVICFRSTGHRIQMFVIIIYPLRPPTEALSAGRCDIIIHVLSSHLHVREQWDQSSGWVGNHISDTPQPSAASCWWNWLY